MGAAIIAGCNAPPILEFSEHACDLVALAIERFGIGAFGFTAPAGRDAGFDAF